MAARGEVQGEKRNSNAHGSALDGVESAYMDIIREVYGASERAGAIVAAAQLEDALQKAILSRLIYLDTKEMPKIFEGSNAPLGTFYSKIYMGYAMGIFSSTVRSDMLTIKDIRNKFAHIMEIRTFDHPVIENFCSKLHYPESLVIDNSSITSDVIMSPRERFEITTSQLHLDFFRFTNKLLSAPNIGRSPMFIDYPERPGTKPQPSPGKIRVRPTNRDHARNHGK